MWNYPDGMSGREFDSKEYEVECPKCKEMWWEDVSTEWGPPEEFEVECNECGHGFMHTVIDDRY